MWQVTGLQPGAQQLRTISAHPPGTMKNLQGQSLQGCSVLGQNLQGHALQVGACRVGACKSRAVLPVTLLQTVVTAGS